ncbi:MAG: YwaF family protein, partial [Oscillospiraceae bacterium]|nr:YwaF family protein [Oscillospiraceae bacterium]
MFTLNHFIWLALAALVAALFVRYDKKHGETAALSLLCGCCIASECIKLYSNIAVTPEGATLPTEVLPFHLCSMQILVIFALRFSKNEGLRRHLYEFCWPTASFGAFCALLIPTEGVTFFETAHTYEYFLFHGLLVGFGITIVRRFGSTFNGKSYIACLTGVG